MAKKMKDFKNRLFSRLETGIREHVGLDVQDVAVGITYTAVLLSNGILGVSASYLGKNFESCFNAGKIHDVGCFHECDLEGLVKKIFSEHAIERSVGYAAINALSQHILHQEKVKLENVDVLDIVGKFPGEPIFMVGKIRPIYNALKKKGRKVLVKDFNKGIQDPGMGESYDGGILIITGSSLSNETLGNELDTFKNVRLAIFIGPSAQVLPGWLFDLTNIDVVASMFFSSPLEAFTAIKQGGGTPNFVRHARKYTFFKNNIIT